MRCRAAETIPVPARAARRHFPPQRTPDRTDGAVPARSLPVCARARRDQHGDELFPGARQGAALPDHYGPAQRRAVYSSRNPTELALGMQGVFTVQPAVEWLLCVIFLSLYARRATHGKQAQSTRGNPLHAVGKLTARPFLPAEPVRVHSRPAAGARLFPFGFLLHTGAPFAVRRLTPRPKSE